LSADGKHIQLIVQEELTLGYPSGFSWSPDGTRLAFLSGRDRKVEIYIVNADGSKLTRLTEHPAVDDSPTWSPDGQQIAFRSNRDGHFEIYVVNVDGSNLRRITNSPEDKLNPAWAPQ
jgi:Tol biopolymer transport system component